MKHLLLSALFALTALAQPFPDAATLERLNADFLKARSSIQYIVEVSREETVPGNPFMNPSQSSATTTYRAILPNKVRIDGDGDGMWIISNGVTVWTYLPLGKLYSRQAMRAELLVEIAPMSASSIGDPKVVRAEVMTVDGRPRNCWVEEIHTIPGVSMTTFTDYLLTRWIDQENGLALREEMSGKIAGLPGSKFHSVRTMRNIRYDEPLAASLFEFTPPAGAKEMPATRSPAAR